jgi:hypothetical protein
MTAYRPTHVLRPIAATFDCAAHFKKQDKVPIEGISTRRRGERFGIASWPQSQNRSSWVIPD